MAFIKFILKKLASVLTS